jgi:5-methylcytosine-specific restriction endonuclease McrA
MAKKPHRFGRPSTARRRLLRHRLMCRDGPRCTCCEVLFTADNPPTIEHLQAISAGGRNLPANLVLLCARCNQGRDHALPLAATGSGAW